MRIKNFQASAQLTGGLVVARRQMSQHLAGANPDAQQKYRRRYGNATDEQVIKTIVKELRGYLHHQSAKRRRTWHPGLPRDYGVDAHFLGAVCQCVLLNLVDKFLAADVANQKLMATNIVQSEATPLGANIDGR